MKATIWHNPACGTSRKTLAILQETPGVKLTVIEYLKQPYAADKLRQLFADAGLSAREALRLREAHAAPDSLAMADALNTLGVVLEARDRGDEAEPLLRRALAIRSAALGEDSLSVA